MSRQQAFDNLKKNAVDFHDTFSSPEGQRVIKHLENEFEKKGLANVDNPNETFYRLGGRDLLVYIKQMVETHERNVTGADNE